MPKKSKVLNEKHTNACVLLKQDQGFADLHTSLGTLENWICPSRIFPPTLFSSLFNCQCKSYDENCMFCLAMMTILTEKEKTYFSRWTATLDFKIGVQFQIYVPIRRISSWNILVKLHTGKTFSKFIRWKIIWMKKNSKSN